MKTRENKAMRFASVLLVLTLLATSLTAGTFAKYTTGAEGAGKARVAKFGVDVSVDTSQLFSEKYGANDAIVTDVSDTGITVQADTAESEKNVVAPGTSGSMTFEISGNPETSVNLKIGMTDIKEVMLKGQTYRKGEDGTGKTVSDEVYYPVKWTLTKGATTVQHNSAELKDTTLTKINEYFASISTNDDNSKKLYAPNTLNTVAGQYKLSWAWDFDTTNSAGTNDVADTILGDIVAGDEDEIKKANATGNYEDLVDGTDYCTAEEFKLTISVTQVD